MGIGLIDLPGGSPRVVCDGPEERLSAAMGLLNAATAELVAAIAEALSSGGRQGDGIASPEPWVACAAG